MPRKQCAGNVYKNVYKKLSFNKEMLDVNFLILRDRARLILSKMYNRSGGVQIGMQHEIKKKLQNTISREK